MVSVQSGARADGDGFPGGAKRRTTHKLAIWCSSCPWKGQQYSSIFYTVVPKGYKTEWKICPVIVNMKVVPFEMKPPSTNVYIFTDFYRFQNLPHLTATSVNLLAALTALCTFTDFCGLIYDVHSLSNISLFYTNLIWSSV